MLAGSPENKGEPNFFVYDYSGSINYYFRGGDAFSSVLVLNKRIVVGYIDQGVYSDDDFSQNGITVFDFSGKVKYAHNRLYPACIINDCYSLSPYGETDVLFSAYCEEVPLGILDLEETAVYQIEVHKKLHGSEAFVLNGDRILFRNYDFVAVWNRENGMCRKHADLKGNVRSVRRGRLLQHNHYTKEIRILRF